MFKKLQKNQKGFTLVEVIVVAVIVAVLAAVTIPLYMGYIKDSRINVANNTAGTVASAFGATKQQNATNVPAAQQYVSGAVISLPGESGTPNNIIVPLEFTVTTTANTVVCNSTKDVTAFSKTFSF
jgi:type IV pilus assembly protein PilA